MRLNRGTLGILVLSLAAIAVVFFINNSKVNAPADTTGTPTATAQPGPLFANINSNTLTRLEIVENASGAKTVLVRTTGSALTTLTPEQVATQEVVATEDPNATAEVSTTQEVAATEEIAATSEVVATEEVAATAEVVATEETAATPEASPTLDPLITPTAMLDPLAPIWMISEVTNLTDRMVDVVQSENAVVVFAALTSVDSFGDADPANFGLAPAKYSLIATANDGSTFRVDVGLKNPVNSQRYYALVNGDTTKIYQVQADQLDSLINLVTNPPYVPLPTATLTPSNTPNPYSEVEQTQTAIPQQTQTAAAAAAQTAASPLMASPVIVPTNTPAPVTPTEINVTEEPAATVEVIATEDAAATPEVTPTSS